MAAPVRRWATFKHEGGTFEPMGLPKPLSNHMLAKYLDDIRTDKSVRRTILVDTDWLTAFYVKGQNELIVWWRDE